VRLRATPEDFRVDEIPLYRPAGEGEHTFVLVEKRERTTEEVARELAQAAGVRPRDVGYAGRKDRVAVATQWFSVPGAARRARARGRGAPAQAPHRAAPRQSLPHRGA
jgi:tRNA pseudouridine13 synthase